MQKIKYRMIGTFDKGGDCIKTEILKFNNAEEFDPKSEDAISLDDGTSLMCIGEISSVRNNTGSVLRMKLNDNIKISINRDTELKNPEEPAVSSLGPDLEKLDPSLMVRITQPVIHSFTLGRLDDPIPSINKIGLWALTKSRLLKFHVDWQTLSDFVICMNTISDPEIYIPVVSDTMYWQEIYNAITYRSERVVCVLYGEGACTKTLNRMIVYVDRARNNESLSQVFQNAADCFHRLLEDYHCWPTPMEDDAKVMKVKIVLN